MGENNPRAGMNTSSIICEIFFRNNIYMYGRVGGLGIAQVGPLSGTQDGGYIPLLVIFLENI